ncbi:hepatocyte growth factor receptor-like [Plakobranchus ocellatus]|uniref:Hepatocyte growth factor receptor-like n=1 Tax=Plakobranchus ocellatus TaxID=259542 RepID=A0AAV4CNF5_9GAST|nr:hepatocyte growth factor receptor-like [Plakobranchus ocellatus]
MTKGKEYPLLTSAVLGFSDIQLNLSTERTPVLFAAFGAARKSSSRRADARLGGAVCVFTIHTLNKELNFAVQLCNHANNLAQPASWIKGAKDKCVFSSKSGQQCSSDPDNPCVQGVTVNSIKALVGFHKTAVCTLWTYTPRLFSASSSLSYQKMSLFLLTLDGLISKIILSMTKKRDDITIKEGNAGISEYHKLNVDLLTINGTWNGQPLPVGATDGSSAFMYVSNGHKVLSLSLDYCRQFQTCEMCVASGPCLWCPAERSCLGEESTGTQCRTTESNTCPPRLDSFQPTSVPTDGGSVLTLYGNQLGTITDEYSKVVVSICDQPCDNVKAKGTNITCTVRKKCSSCQDSCRVNVSVDIRSLPSKYNLTGGSRLTYVNPEVSEFFPEYGPVSGRTQVSLKGQHLDSGRDTTVKIAGTDCEIVSRHESVILCNVVGNKESKPGCGSVDLTIDNFHTNESQVNYCLRPDPIIQSIAPLRSIESGGIIITINGFYLDSATSFSLELHTPLDGQDDDEILLQPLGQQMRLLGVPVLKGIGWRT